ncbi:THO complex subunit 5B [Iris pallida]|uniref:THO complex subunit 5B n=1 Tax=Iris pallida TaxID=29817 RepID=A0AAX6DU82_IRIPA|nr:THO complex subunit 5B [Iris pallida]
MEAEFAGSGDTRGTTTAHEVLEERRTEMEEIAAKMLFLKKEGKPKTDLRELITNASLLFISLRQVNRSILLEEDRVKAETESAKAPVDFTTLQLHNLMYEKNHYMKAIKACKDFRSKYPDIDLVPEAEFFNSAPEEVKGGVLANDAAHDLMLKRLNFELHQRKELCKLHEKLEERKRTLLETIANRKKFLTSLPSHLKSLKKASLPVQQQLGILHTKKLKQSHAAELLAPPLYIVYSQLLAQKEAFGEMIELEITGSTKDAQTFAHQQANRDNAGTSTNTENSRLEEDVPDEEEDAQRRRKRPKKNLVKDNIDQVGIHQSHPLKVVLSIYDDEDSGHKPLKLISLKFEYLVKLNVVCVGIEEADGGSEDILCNLFPNDTGMELPHQTAKLHAGDLVIFDEKKTSRPYKWAQHLAGIDFLQEVPPLHVCSEIQNSEKLEAGNVTSGLSLYRHQNRVQTVVQRIRARKKAQMALMEQLDSLLKLKFPFLAYENVPWASHTRLCNMHHWSIAYTVAAEQVAESVERGVDGISITPRPETESAQEDGELPVASLVANLPEDSRKTISNGFSELEHSRGLALISKSITPSKRLRSQSFNKHEDDLDLLLESESDLEEQLCTDTEAENVSFTVEKPWEEYGAREFHLVLGRKDRNEQMIKLEAKVKICREYPLRPPFFILSLSVDGEQVRFEWFNELRAMEAEVNHHILRILPLECENYVLAHQVHYLAMLFDFHCDTRNEKRKSTSVIDVGLCKPVSGSLLARSVRGRDRRKMLSWKSMGCTSGYPC